MKYENLVDILQSCTQAAYDMTEISRPVWKNWSADEYGLTWTSGMNYHFILWAQLPPNARQNWDTDPRQVTKDVLEVLLSPCHAGLPLLKDTSEVTEW
jgi:hypothetical protein